MAIHVYQAYHNLIRYIDNPYKVVYAALHVYLRNEIYNMNNKIDQMCSEHSVLDTYIVELICNDTC